MAERSDPPPRRRWLRTRRRSSRARLARPASRGPCASGGARRAAAPRPCHLNVALNRSWITPIDQNEYVWRVGTRGRIRIRFLIRIRKNVSRCIAASGKKSGIGAVLSEQSSFAEVSLNRRRALRILSRTCTRTEYMYSCMYKQLTEYSVKQLLRENKDHRSRQGSAILSSSSMRTFATKFSPRMAPEPGTDSETRMYSIGCS